MAPAPTDPYPDTRAHAGAYARVVWLSLSAQERVRLFCNVKYGVDVDLAQLRRCYDGIIFACGAAGDRTLGLPGEEEEGGSSSQGEGGSALAGVRSARDFVAWYNGLPSHRHLDFDLARVRSVRALPPSLPLSLSLSLSLSLCLGRFQCLLGRGRSTAARSGLDIVVLSSASSGDG
jgi:hypothetical protein